MSYFLPDGDPVLAACRGLAMSHPDSLALSTNPLFLKATKPAPGRRVALVSGGGAGHEPLHTGLLGCGGLDAVCPGAVFTSPHNRAIVAASLSAVRAGGVLHIVKNYTGDRINFGIAAERLRALGVPVAQVIVDDDLASETAGAGRRGTAGTVIVEKLLGAAADRGDTLEDLASLGREITSRTRTLGICARAHTSPSTAHPAFRLPLDHVDYGVGIHGERGPRSIPLSPAQDLVCQMLADLLPEIPSGPEGLLVVVSGLGGTSVLEVQALSAIVVDQLTARGASVAAVLHGSHTTALDMAGFSVSLTALKPGWLELWQAGADTPLTTWPRVAATPQLIETPSALQPRVLTPEASPADCVVLSRFTDIVADVHTALAELDQRAGDGDFADNLAGGLSLATARAASTREGGLAAAAAVFLDQVGGTSGPLFGLIFQHLAAACPDDARPDVAVLAQSLADATTTIRRVGGAGPGDRTMVDALLPAVQSLQASVADDDTAKSALTDAALAALAGARSTDRMVGGRGRSSYLGDRALGTPDPGAIGVALLLVAFAGAHEPQHAARIPAPTSITRLNGSADVPDRLAG